MYYIQIFNGSNQKLNYCQLCLPAECLDRLLNAIISISLSYAIVVWIIPALRSLMLFRNKPACNLRNFNNDTHSDTHTVNSLHKKAAKLSVHVNSVP